MNAKYLIFGATGSITNLQINYLIGIRPFTSSGKRKN